MAATIEALVHFRGWILLRGNPDDHSWDSSDSFTRLDIGEDNAASTYLGTRSDLDATNNFRPGTDEHPRADNRVAVSGMLARAAERHLVHDRDIILDDRRLSDDE